MNLQQQIEELLPSADQWEWLEKEARYRIKPLKKTVWFGLQVLEVEDQIKAKPVFVIKGNSVDLIQTHIPFLSIKDAIDHFENVKNKVSKIEDTSEKVLKILCKKLVTEKYNSQPRLRK